MYLVKNSTIILYASLIVAGLAALASCSGGGLTAGAGGSGIGGTGVTLVKGNIATVVADRGDPHGISARMLASMSNLVSTPVLAESSDVGGIRVSGGGQSAITDDLGRFELTNVSPSTNFIINLLLVDSQQIDFSIGPVPQGAKVQVNNIVVNASQGAAKPASVEVEVEVEVDDGNSSGDGTSGDSGNGEDSSGGDDGASTDEPDEPDEPDDGNSTDEPDEPDEPEDGDSTDEPDELDDGDDTDEPDEPEDNTSSDDKGN